MIYYINLYVGNKSYLVMVYNPFLYAARFVLL